MPVRPLGFGSTVQQFISGTPTQRAPVAGKAKPGVPNVIEAANRIRADGLPNELDLNVNSRPNRAATVKRGRLSIPQRGTGRIFMFNPNDVSDTKGINYGSIEVPGASHPVYQYGAGGERLITFDLYIDGDRGRFGREQARDNSSLSIKDELHWYRSLIYPSSFGMSYAEVAPYLVLFTYGELYVNLPCIVKKADWKVNYWVPDPKSGGRPMPVRATIPLQLAEAASHSQTANDVLSEGELTAYEV